MTAPRHLGVLLFPEAEELDAVGPWEVLGYWTRSFPEDGYDLSTLSQSGGRIECAKGLVLEAQYSYADAPDCDVLVYPGGRGVRRHLQDEFQLDWVRRTRQGTPLMTSVCTGSLVFAAAGLLKERPATTHWRSLETLHELDPTIDVRPHERFVDDGDLITAAGISAGIDMALHIVQRLAGRERAQEVRRGIQYDPDPPV